MRYSIKYTKASNIKFVAHLDLMRTIQRTFRRAELPVEHSKGFNPHMTLSIAQPLSVGMHSCGEYLDVVFQEEVDENVILEKLNKNAPNGIEFLNAVKVGEDKNKQSMALIDGARYTLKIKCDNVDEAENSVKDLLNIEKWETVKKTKKGTRTVDLKALIKEFEYVVEDDEVVIRILSACGSQENLSAKLLGEYIKENCSVFCKDRFVDIKREELYTYKGEKLVSLYEYFK